jgi:hypothetical protein
MNCRNRKQPEEKKRRKRKELNNSHQKPTKIKDKTGEDNKTPEKLLNLPTQENEAQKQNDRERK